MLDPRIYRGALVPVLLAVIVFAFSLGNQPAPARTTLVPDAFVAERAFDDLQELAGVASDRAPGSAGDEAVARRVAAKLRAAAPTWDISTATTEAETIDGRRRLTTVLARQAGQPGPQLVVVAHRDAAQPRSFSQLSGTATLLELARALGNGRLQRTVTLASTSGGSGGAGGARDLVRRIVGPVGAVLVLGDVGGVERHRPVVGGWSGDGGQASLALRRTVEAAVALEAGERRTAAQRATTQWARLAAPFATGEQGPLAAAGLPAVLLSGTAERTPDRDEAVSEPSLRGYGRAALRTLNALDTSPSPPTGADRDLVTLRKVVPGWAVRVLVGALLLAPLLVALDGLARARRRGRAVLPWLGWIAATGVVALGMLLFARVLGLTGLLGPATAQPSPPGAIPLDGMGWVGLVAVALAGALLALVVRPVLLRIAHARTRAPDDGAGVALILASALVAAVLWVFNPYAAMLLVPAAHLWLLVAAPEAPLPRAVRLVLVLLGLVPLVLLGVVVAAVLGTDAGGLIWWAVLAVAGGQGGVVGWLLWSVVAGCVALAVALARRPRAAPAPPARLSVRGPMTYAGPGSLGGTESALRR